MTDSNLFSAILQQRWPFLQDFEENLAGRKPILSTDLSAIGSDITTPLSLQHVGMQIVEIAKSDWTTVKGLDKVVAYLGELADLWEMIFLRHQEAAKVFAGAEQRPYCLFLRSFTGVSNPIEVPGARATMYLNEPELDTNFASTLMTEAGWLNPVSCMHTDDMQLLIRSGATMPAFRVQTANWQRVLADAIASSGMVIFYLSGESPGVRFELDLIRKTGLQPQTIVIHRGEECSLLDYPERYASVMPVSRFLVKPESKTGPGRLSRPAEVLLRELSASATTRTAPAQRLLTLPCEVVDSGVPPGFDPVEVARSYFITPSNVGAFVHYVELLPDSFLRWNAISQDIRLRGIQPDMENFNELYRSLRMAFVASACLGFTGSIACTIGLLSKVTSMAKQGTAEDQARVGRYMEILDRALRFDVLTRGQKWGEKIEAFRQSILKDPY